MPKREVQILDTGSELAVNRLVKRIMTATGPWEVYFEPWQPVRTLTQNSYLHAVVYESAAALMSELYGEHISKDQAHEMLKERFLPVKEHVGPDGEVTRIPPTTTTLDTAEFGQYVDKIILWCAEYGVSVPQANGQWKEVNHGYESDEVREFQQTA